MQVANASGNQYSGGQLGLFPTGSGSITFGATTNFDATFLVHLTDGSVPPPGTNSRPPMAAFLNNIMPETAPTTSANWAVVPAFPNLLFTNALGILPVPGTNLLCVFEREGRVWTFVNNSNTSTKTLVLDISGQCQGWDDSGLMNVAFHPGFVTNGFMFVYYTWVTNGTVVGSPTTRPTEYSPGKYHDRLSRFTMTNGLSSLGSELVLVDQSADSVWHNGSGLFFHPTNGFLYWTDGDDERYPTQTITNNLLSGVFRIDVEKRGGAISHPIPRQPKLGSTTNYFIPNDNPFVGVTNAMEEFFCLGLRSPHRMTIDPPTGKIYLGDVGAGSREEIDVMLPGESGLNFQWSTIEGLNGDLVQPYIGINRRPVLDYTHAEGNAVIGGHVYRGSEFAAELGGKYIFGDNVVRKIWVMDESTTPATKLQIGTIPAGAGPNSGSSYVGLSSFGLDANGEIYMCQMSSVGGQIYKLAHGSPTASRPLPTLLSQTGVFTNLATLAPDPGLIPYTVNSPLWSDGAQKSRWLALATNAYVTFATNGEWSFPNGVVFVKNFALATNDTNPSQLKRLETRLLVIGTNGLAYGAGYKWRPDNSDADLVQTLTNENITITTATGTRTQTWSYPGRSDCLTCHTIAAGSVLGVKTRQLNGTNFYPALGTNDNQLRIWNQYSLFSQPISEAAIPTYSKTVPISNTNATLATRVRSYLDANCAQCHRPGGGVQANFDARFDTPLASQGIVSGPVQNNQGISGALVVTPGDLAHSLLYVRDNNVGTSLQMPPLAKNTIDTNYIAVLAQWITTLVPPTVSAIADITIPINSSTGPIPFTVGDANVAPGSLIVTGTSSRTTLVPNANIVFGGSGSNRTVNVTPLVGQFGSATISVTVDNGLAPVTETFVVTVPGQLVAWYKFENNAQDSSGFANHGTPGGTFIYVAGKVDTSAISFDGSSGYSQIPLSVSNDFTLMLWVNTTDTGGVDQWWAGKGLLDGEMAGAGNDFGTALVGAKAGFGVGNPDTTIVSTTSINDGTWHHVAATRDSASGEIKLYIDGTLENSLVTTATGVRVPTNLRIGSIRTGTTGSFFAGSIDDARIYNYVMNAGEIAALLNTPPSLAAISNRVIMAGTILNITNSATDAGSPPQTLTFNLAGTPPAGASINPSNGILNWRPTVAQGGTTNLFTVQVADNGTPVMTDAKNFSVVVNRPMSPGLSNATITNGQFRLTIAGDFGPDYTVLASTNLASWTSIFTTNQPTLPFVFRDPNLTNYNQRFYRVRLDP
jgi:uncharacterized repeat protein (TIGR03806 family)